jgi:tRNA dimethylallyltransferase
MLRALEVLRATGQSIRTYQQKNKKTRPFDIISIRLDLPREELYQRINNRVGQMMQNGLWEEAQSLYPYRHLNALQTVGYKEIFDYIERKSTMEEAVELIKRNTRHFAKRQCTWFANQLPAELFHPEDINSILKHIVTEVSKIG